jgi:glutaminase
MLNKRTDAEKAGALLAIQQLKITPEWTIYQAEVMRIHNAIACGAYKESGEQLVKTVGVLHGMDLTLNIEQFLKPKA